MDNFTSFKIDTTVEIDRTNYKILSDKNIYEDTLKGVMFVGANASGKTNIIRGLKFLLDMLFAEKNLNLSTYHCLFSKETYFVLEYDFNIKGHSINYLIQYDVAEEAFIEKLKIDNRVVLNRVGSSAETEITEAKIYSDIDKNSLLLREIYFNTKFRNNSVLKEWFLFLLNSVYLDGYKRQVFSPGKFPLGLNEYLEAEGVESINSFFEVYNFNQRVEYSNKSSGQYTAITAKEKDIFFKREGVGEPIPYPMESLGNQNLLNLLPSFFHVIKNGGMLIVDEFSSGLHNFLEELLIAYFMKHSKNSQIIFVSHSTNLLTNSLLRPDQLYAVDFVSIDGSKIKRFSSEKPREAQNLEKMYTSGVFGGIPKFSDEKNNFE
ncbi:AAA family ATPase [Bacillus niameyensis]|uniref:AAA family ATPase n=1 Tax=Bacillus niameyensis TaxID=1522308 RepID=UPI001E44F859|nr:AAA family ATPase [Bacillus niameyensis]